jgi:hypothetical protein
VDLHNARNEAGHFYLMGIGELYNGNELINLMCGFSHFPKEGTTASSFEMDFHTFFTHLYVYTIDPFGSRLASVQWSASQRI